MLKITKEQMEVFEQAAIRNFEDRILEHLNEHFPKQHSMLGEFAARNVIRQGFERAKSYGLTTERNVSLYINLMFMLGSGFDTDLQLPWAAEVLTDETILDETERIDRLSDRATQYLDYVAGGNNEHIDAALLKMRQERIEALPESDAGNFENHMVKLLNKIFPQKCEYMGKNCVRQLIQRGIESATNHGITIQRGFVIYIGMMFMLGSGFATDPQFPWVAEILKDKDIEDQNKRVDRLYEGAMAYLERWLTGPGE
ncbi:MAG: hypothetical protein JW883_17055 [Deltaproteobacteria bacterium]|nr:hypothetical protein [Deltaproteobacteria bacterium]